MTKWGRPRIYDDPEAFADKVQSYFDNVVDASGRPPTLPGLCAHLGFNSRDTLYEYGKRDGFSDAVTRAKLLIEQDRAERLVLKDEYTPGLPMDLRVNHGWEDPQKHELTGKDGGPITSVDLSKLTDDQLGLLETALGLVAESGGGEGGEETPPSDEGA